MEDIESASPNLVHDKNPPNCPKCGHKKWHVEGRLQCPNCATAEEPKTGHTLIVTEPLGEKGPVKIHRVTEDEKMLASAQSILETRKKTEQPVLKEPEKPGTVLVHVPVSLFPDLCMWARKLKLPRDWKEAEKIKAITDFQIEINTKLGGLGQ